jgi:hypothetical protein
LRGVRKSGAPPDLEGLRRVLQQELVEREPGAARLRAREAFNEGRRALPIAECLAHEQRGLRVYCESRVSAPPKEGRPSPTIEHWQPLSERPAEALDWENLYLSCPSHYSCNAARGDLRWELPPPSQLRYEHELRWSVSGAASVALRPVHLNPKQREQLSEAVRATRGGLNLNAEALCAARRRSLQGLQERLRRLLPGERNTREARSAEADRLEEQDELPPYLSFQLAWLRGQLGSPSSG